MTWPELIGAVGGGSVIAVLGTIIVSQVRQSSGIIGDMRGRIETLEQGREQDREELRKCRDDHAECRRELAAGRAEGRRERARLCARIETLERRTMPP